MATTLLKPRWEAWENLCVQKAFAQKIQHKIMAIALGRTVSAVNKKITTLGLRAPSRVRGRIKGIKQNLSQMEKTPQDLSKMIEILQAYAPLKCFQMSQLALKKRYWTRSETPLCKEANKESYFGSIDLPNPEFSYTKALDFIPSKHPFSKNIGSKNFSQEPAYVSLRYVEKWADSEGFHRIRGVLQHRGLSYWKDGRYFSQAQLLMYVNRLRFEYHLQPLVLIEEEREISS